MDHHIAEPFVRLYGLFANALNALFAGVSASKGEDQAPYAMLLSLGQRANLIGTHLDLKPVTEFPKPVTTNRDHFVAQAQ